MYRCSAFFLCLLAGSASWSHAQVPRPLDSQSPAAEQVIEPVPTIADRTIDLVTTKTKLVGHLVNAEGQAIPAASVHLVERRRVVEVARTNGRGEFTFSRITPGPKSVVVGSVSQPIRMWDAESAPPQAHQRLMVVAGTTVRGQCVPPATQPVGCHPHSGQEVLYRILQRPWLVAAGTATAIALPIALGDDDDGDREFANQIAQPDAS